MGRKENEKVGIFNCHGMGGNQVNSLFLSASYLGGYCVNTQGRLWLTANNNVLVN